MASFYPGSIVRVHLVDAEYAWDEDPSKHDCMFVKWVEGQGLIVRLSNGDDVFHPTHRIDSVYAVADPEVQVFV